VGIDLGQHGSTWVNKVVRDSMDGWYDLVPGAFFFGGPVSPVESSAQAVRDDT